MLFTWVSSSAFLRNTTIRYIHDMSLTTDNESDTTFEDIINDILSQDNVMLSVKSTGAICEVNTEIIHVCALAITMPQ